MAQDTTNPQAAGAEINLRLVERFIEAMESKDFATIRELVAEDVTVTHPITFSGRQEPEFVVQGEAALGYLQSVFTNFSQIDFVDTEYTVSQDGSRIFFEAKGFFRLAQGDRPYNNVYLLRFDIVDEAIVFVREYANPVTASAALGIPLGMPEGDSSE